MFFKLEKLLVEEYNIFIFQEEHHIMIPPEFWL
jgi:hypothetical protein